MSQNGWNQFGWEGISFLKPEEWELGKVEGAEAKGYLRLDDHLFSRVEIRWQIGRWEEKILTKHLGELERKAKRQKIDFNILAKRDYSRKEAEGRYFIWEGDVRAVNLMTWCKKCRRLVLVRVLGERGEEIEEKAERLFNSLRDHPHNKNLWAVFGFCFTTPLELRLNRHSFLSGHLRFDFERGGDSFIFERLSVASIILKGKSLSQWAREFCQAQFKEVDIGVSYPREGSPEEGVYITGREHGKVKFFKKRFFKSLFWHCPRTNHLFGAAELVKKIEETSLDSLVPGVTCH